MLLEQLRDQVHNNVIAGIRSLTVNASHSPQQIEDELVSEYQTVLREFMLRGYLVKSDFYRKIACVPVECGTMEGCCPIDGMDDYNRTPVQTVRLPEIITDYGSEGVSYIGSVDMSTSYTVYFSRSSASAHKYRMRGGDKAFAYIEPATLDGGFVKGYIFNAPLAQMVSIIAMFKDPRQVAEYDCCSKEVDFPNHFIATEMVKRLTEKYLRYYRQMATPPTPSDLTPKP
jgi:hypothetical protein